MMLVAFEEKDLKKILELLKIDTSHNKVGICETCKRDLFLNNIGNIAKGKDKTLLYCDNPACFSIKIAERYSNNKKGEQDG